jgi:hypothetical protein
MILGTVAVAAGVAWYVLSKKTAPAKYQVGHILFKEGIGTYYITAIGKVSEFGNEDMYTLNDYVTGATTYWTVSEIDNDPLWIDMGTQIA